MNACTSTPTKSIWSQDHPSWGKSKIGFQIASEDHGYPEVPQLWPLTWDFCIFIYPAIWIVPMCRKRFEAALCCMFFVCSIRSELFESLCNGNPMEDPYLWNALEGEKSSVLLAKILPYTHSQTLTMHVDRNFHMFYDNFWTIHVTFCKETFKNRYIRGSQTAVWYFPSFNCADPRSLFLHEISAHSVPPSQYSCLHRKTHWSWSPKAQILLHKSHNKASTLQDSKHPFIINLCVVLCSNF